MEKRRFWVSEIRHQEGTGIGLLRVRVWMCLGGMSDLVLVCRRTVYRRKKCTGRLHSYI